MGKLVKIAEVAEALGVGLNTAKRMMYAGKIPVKKLSSRCHRYDMDAVRKALEKFERKAK